MNEETRSYTQNNNGEKVFANQGGPQYNNDGHVFANQGRGTQHINFQQMADKYKGGLDALKHRLYSKAVERFEDFLSTAESVSAPGTDIEEWAARAHVYEV